MRRLTSLDSLALLIAFGFGACEPRGGSSGSAVVRDSLVARTSGSVYRVPADSEIPKDAVGASIRRGRALLVDTKDSLPDHVGNHLRCVSCHLDLGTRANGLSLIGVYSRFPQYRSRNGLVNLIEDRVNDCFERSMNGTVLPRDGRDMRDLISYMAFLSRGVAPPGMVLGANVSNMTPLRADPARGQTIFAETCVRCHGPNGEGTVLAKPLWGPHSFNIGAGMARLRTAAPFIRYNMPNDRAVVLTDQQAFDVAGFVLSHPRPDFKGKENDWPNGDPPPDVAYPTRASVIKAKPASAPRTPTPSRR